MDTKLLHTADIEVLLKRKQVRPTANRISILRELLSAEAPLSMAAMEQRLLTIDKSGLSRTLGLFAARELVHVIDDGSGAAKYEVCHGDSSRHTIDDMHPHFHCVGCGGTTCLADAQIPAVALPDGYRAIAVNYVVKGLCPACARKNRQISAK